MINHIYAINEFQDCGSASMSGALIEEGIWVLGICYYILSYSSIEAIKCFIVQFYFSTWYFFYVYHLKLPDIYLDPARTP